MNKTVIENPALLAFRLAEENMCAGYLAARKAMVDLAARAVSLGQLVCERPTRRDYRAQRDAVVESFTAAAERTRLAYAAWVRAQLRTDAQWSDTTGRDRWLAAVTDAAVA